MYRQNVAEGIQKMLKTPSANPTYGGFLLDNLNKFMCRCIPGTLQGLLKMFLKKCQVVAPHNLICNLPDF